MCWMAAIPLGMVAAGALKGSYDSSKAEGAAITSSRLSNIEQLRQMNIQNANMSLQAREKLEESTSDLTDQNLSKLQAMGAVRAAIGESGLEGNSMNRVARISEGQYVREAAKVTENYRRDYQSIFAGQLGNIESTRNQIRYSQKSETKGQSALSQAISGALGIGAAAASAFGSNASTGKGKAPISAAKGTPTGR